VPRLNLEPFSLRNLISDTLSGFQPQARHQGVRLVGEVSEDVDPVLMDLPGIQRVLQNWSPTPYATPPSAARSFCGRSPEGRWCK
jgi:hypothetical protein